MSSESVELSKREQRKAMTLAEDYTVWHGWSLAKSLRLAVREIKLSKEEVDDEGKGSKSESIPDDVQESG